MNLPRITQSIARHGVSGAPEVKRAAGLDIGLSMFGEIKRPPFERLF